jgi:hypothetical protein
MKVKNGILETHHFARINFYYGVSVMDMNGSTKKQVFINKNKIRKEFQNNVKLEG